MKCDELREEIYERTVELIRFVMSKNPSSEQYVNEKKYLEAGSTLAAKTLTLNTGPNNVQKYFTAKELRNKIMGEGMFRGIPSKIDPSIDEMSENIYTLLSQYKFCLLESYRKKDTFEPDPVLHEYSLYSAPKLLEILKTICLEEESNPIVLPQLDNVAECLDKKEYFNAIIKMKKIMLRYRVWPDGYKTSGIDYFPTPAYENYRLTQDCLEVIVDIRDVATKLEQILDLHKKNNLIFSQPWDHYLPQIITGIRNFEIEAFDHFDLCIVGKFALQDEFGNATPKIIRDLWLEVIELLGESKIESCSNRDYPYPLFRGYPYEPNYINRK